MSPGSGVGCRARTARLRLAAPLLGRQPSLLRAAGGPGGPTGCRRGSHRVAQQVGHPLARGHPVAALLAVLRRGHDEQPAADEPRVERPQHPAPLGLGEPGEGATSSSSSTRLSAVLTPWPPGPDDRENRSTSRSPGTVRPCGTPGPGGTTRSIRASPCRPRARAAARAPAASSRSAHSSSGAMSKTASSMPACRSPSSAYRFGTVAMVKSFGSTSSSSSHRNGRRDRADVVAAHRVGGGDRVVARVLVVVDEHRLGVAVLAPPGRRDVVGDAALHLPRERQRRPAHVAEPVVGADPHVDVQPVAPTRLRPPHGAQLVEHLVGDVRGPPHAGEGGVRHRVEVDAPLVGLLGVGPAAVPRVELDGAHLHRPGDVGQPGDAQLVGVQAVAGEVQPHRLDPRRRTARAAASGAPCARRRRRGSGAACTAARAAR